MVERLKSHLLFTVCNFSEEPEAQEAVVLGHAHILYVREKTWERRERLKLHLQMISSVDLDKS